MWTATTNTSDFESETLKELILDVVEFYVDRDDQIPNIESVFWMDNHGSQSKLSNDGLVKFKAKCEEDYEEQVENAAIENQYMLDTRSDYFASVL